LHVELVAARPALRREVVTPLMREGLMPGAVELAQANAGLFCIDDEACGPSAFGTCTVDEALPPLREKRRKREVDLTLKCDVYNLSV
jgi:hypothetical protein